LSSLASLRCSRFTASSSANLSAPELHGGEPCGSSAVAELQSRGEDVTSDSLKQEMDRLHDEFTFMPKLLLDLAHLLHLEEELERAHTVELAYYWMAFAVADERAS
jgi:hypothetical protein